MGFLLQPTGGRDTRRRGDDGESLEGTPALARVPGDHAVGATLHVPLLRRAGERRAPASPGRADGHPG